MVIKENNLDILLSLEQQCLGRSLKSAPPRSQCVHCLRLEQERRSHLPPECSPVTGISSLTINMPVLCGLEKRMQIICLRVAYWNQ